MKEYVYFEKRLIIEYKLVKRVSGEGDCIESIWNHNSFRLNLRNDLLETTEIIRKIFYVKGIRGGFYEVEKQHHTNFSQDHMLCLPIQLPYQFAIAVNLEQFLTFLISTLLTFLFSNVILLSYLVHVLIFLLIIHLLLLSFILFLLSILHILPLLATPIHRYTLSLNTTSYL